MNELMNIFGQQTETQKFDEIKPLLDKARDISTERRARILEGLPEEAQRKVAQGAQWLDVRYPSEYLHDRLPGAVNVPLSEVRSTPCSSPTTMYIASSVAAGALIVIEVVTWSSGMPSKTRWRSSTVSMATPTRPTVARWNTPWRRPFARL